MFTHPGPAKRRRERVRRERRETVYGAHRAQRFISLCSILLSRLRHPGSRCPRRIGFHRAAARKHFSKHRVIDPPPGVETDLNGLLLGRGGPQRPRPHMRRRVLGTLTRPHARFDHHVWRTDNCRCGRVDTFGVHTTTVKDTTDIAVPPGRDNYRRAAHSVSALWAHLVFVTKYRRRILNSAMLDFCEHTMAGRMRRSRRRVG
jgi:hypothetical protein